MLLWRGALNIFPQTLHHDDAPQKNIWWTLEHDTPYRFGGVEDKKISIQ